MTSIISTKFRIRNAENFKDSFSTDKFYLFIGRPQPWSNDNVVPTPIDSDASFTEVWRDVISLKRIQLSDASLSIPRRTWSPGTVYDEYAHDYSADNQTQSGESNLYDGMFFVINADYQVFKCLSNGNNAPSTVQPSNTTPSANPARLADGYIWAYMYTLDINSIMQYATPDFIPVLTDTNVSNAAVDGAISAIKVTNKGASYTVTPTVTITGNGSNATAVAVLDVDNTIKYINVTNPGTGYDYATVSITGGNGTSGAAKALISPPGGHGKDAAYELGAFNVTLSTKLEYDEDGDFVTSNDYRRIGIVTNPYNFGTTTPSTVSTLDATKKLILASVPTPGNFVPDDIITGQTSGATGRVVSYDPISRTIKYIKSLSENDIAFSVSEVISNGSETGTIQSTANPEVAIDSGTIIYIDNRRPISRADDQIEQIVITFEF